MALQLVKVLETYRGRDRVMRMATFSAMFLGGSGNTPLAAKFGILAQEFNACRTTLRLFDDLSMLFANIKFFTSPKDTSPVIRILDTFTNSIFQCYYIIEHIAWFTDKKIITTGSSALYWVAGVAIWASALVAEIIKSIVRLSRNKKNQARLKKQKCLDKDDSGSVSEQNLEINEKLKKLKQEEFIQVLSLIQSCADMMNAVNWLPPGFLWAGKISRTKSGFFGMLSSALLLYKNWPAE